MVGSLETASGRSTDPEAHQQEEVAAARLVAPGCTAEGGIRPGEDPAEGNPGEVGRTASIDLTEGARSPQSRLEQAVRTSDRPVGVRTAQGLLPVTPEAESVGPAAGDPAGGRCLAVGSSDLQGQLFYR